MARPDLLALTPDDLATLSNRGLVNRAQRELASGELTVECREDERGTVTLLWSDGIECILPAGKTLAEARCSCPATTLCRHLVRSVLAYQQNAAVESRPPGKEGLEEPAEPRPSGGVQPAGAVPESWDPGGISDEELGRHFRQAALARARQEFEQGHVVELVRSAKPSALIHTLSCTVRFLVPGDIRYTHCDCADAAPCRHVPLAVWAFRLLAEGQASGLVTTGREVLPAPTALLDEIEERLMELVEGGIAGLAPAESDRLRALEGRCREEGLVWPAEILAEIVQQYERYHQRDARFSPLRLAELVSELCLRSDAIGHPTAAVPSLFVRGSNADRVTEVGSARWIGLGCGVRLARRSVELNAYLQDMDTGIVVTVSREFADPEEKGGELPREFWRLAQTPAVKGASFATLGGGQLLIKGGRRSAARRFLPGRASAIAQPQAFQWEGLRAPLLVEDFAELRARLQDLPPACLRPRYASENLYVCPLAGAEAVEFSTVEQSVRAILRDGQGEPATLAHPYTSRGREGAEALLAQLQAQGEGLRFVAGQVRLRAGTLVVAPVALVFQQGKVRTMLQPWIDRWREVQAIAARGSGNGLSERSDPVQAYPGQVTEMLGELLLTGVRKADAPLLGAWRDLHRYGAGLGFVRFLQPMERLIQALDEKAHRLQWHSRPAAQAALELAALARLAQEIG